MIMPPWPIQREIFSLTAPLLQTLADAICPIDFGMAHDITSCQADCKAIWSAKSSWPGNLILHRQLHRHNDTTSIRETAAEA